MDYVSIVRGMLKNKRFEHSLNVAEQAVYLAKLHKGDETKAYTAGILHDICKNMTEEEQLQWVKKSAIILDSNILNLPKAWHGIAGSIYIQEKLGIKDVDIINAVCYHTIAREKMSQLEKIIYLADLTSKERSYSDADRMRKIVKKSLCKGMEEALKFSVGDLVSTGCPICLDTCRAYNHYLSLQPKK